MVTLDERAVGPAISPGPERGGRRRATSRFAIGGALGALAVVLVLSASSLPQTSPAAARGVPALLTPGSYPELPGWDSPTYLHTTTRSATAGGETVLSAATAANLTLLWSYDTGGPVFSSPAVVNGVAYFGSWDGYEYAVQLETGQLVWKTFLGTAANECGAGALGVTSSATVANGTLYVGGGDAHWYALSALNGSVLWNTTYGATANGFYAWSSPLLLGSDMYVGISSQCDHPLVPAALLEINTVSHQIVHQFNTTFNRTRGASIWSSPSYDPWNNEIFATTGNPSVQAGSVPYGDSILQFNATTLALEGSWQLPASQIIVDGDFGATPTVFLPVAGRPIVVAENKNGVEYAWNATNVSKGPIWEDVVANASVADSIAPASWGGGRLFVGASQTVLAGKVVNGGVRAVNPLTGAVEWSRSEWQNVMTAPSYSNGLVFIDSGHHLDVANAATGRTVVSLTALGNLMSAPVVSHGEVLVGAVNGNEYAYGLPMNVVLSASVGVNAQKVTFSGSVSGGFPAYRYAWAFGDRGTSTAAKVTHTFATPGVYNVTLTVTDRTGAVANATVQVIVSAPRRLEGETPADSRGSG